MNADEEAYLRRRVKEELRRRMRAVRSAVPRESRTARSSEITTRVLALDAMKAPRCVAAYAAIRREADPSGIVAALRTRGIETAFPRIHDTEGLRLHVCGPESLVPGTWDIPEPPADAPLATEVDAIVVPGLAFDPRGYRVGYGKGYYDRLLSKWPDAFTIGIAFDFQLVSETPNMPHDVPVRYVVTDKRTLVVP